MFLFFVLLLRCVTEDHQVLREGERRGNGVSDLHQRPIFPPLLLLLLLLEATSSPGAPGDGGGEKGLVEGGEEESQA